MNTRTAILMVDDVEANRHTLRELLAAEDYRTLPFREVANDRTR